MFSNSKYNVLTIYINFTLNVATASFVIICRACLYYKTTEFLYKYLLFTSLRKILCIAFAQFLNSHYDVAHCG